MLGINLLMSDEANKEIDNFLNSPLSMIGAEKSLTYGLASGRQIKLNLYASSYQDLSQMKGYNT